MPGRPESPPTRALAWLYSTPEQRPALAALCALEREIGASLRPGLDHQVAHARLTWWREECERCVQGQPAHPLTRELCASFAPAGPRSLAGVAGLVDTAVWDLAAATFETRHELIGYCERWSAAMIEPLALLAAHGAARDAAAPAGPDAATAIRQARALGVCLREIELLVALAADARAGRLRLPLDELSRAQVSPESLTQPTWPDTLAAGLRERHRELRAALAAAVRALAPAVHVQLRGLIVWSAVACGQSRRAERRLPEARPRRDVHVLSDNWRAWRAARRVGARHAREH